MAISLNLTPYARRHRRDVMNLINIGWSSVHIHLDWQTLDEWLDTADTPTFLVWQNQRLLGVMSGAPPREGTSWLRLVVVAEDADTALILGRLWEGLRAQLVTMGVHEVAVLLLQPWLSAYLGALDFKFVEPIITLERQGWEFPTPLRDDVRVRHADPREVPHIIEVDHAAFGPLWQMSLTGMREAVRNSSSFTVAELIEPDGKPKAGEALVGYQITTPHMGAAHLARLGVRPAVQGGGIGGAILSELIESLLKRGIFSLSVNTQSSNIQSRRLYERYGFTLTGLNMPYWKATLD